MKIRKQALFGAIVTGLIVNSGCTKDRGATEARGEAHNSEIQETLKTVSTRKSDQPNILLIIADDMGTDTMNIFKNAKNGAKTPHLDMLAKQGVLFENAWATPACSTSRAALLTGKHGVHNGVPAVPGKLAQDQIVLQAYLKSQSATADYQSGVFGKWHLAGRDGDPQHPNSLGIDHYSGNLQGNIKDYSNWLETTNGQSRNRTDYHTTAITQSAIDWIKSQQKPWITWIAYSAPHAPFHLPPSELQNSGLDGSDLDNNKRPYYLAMIEAMDSEIGRLISAIPVSERDNTVILFLGDNGTPRPVIDRSVYPGRQGKSSLNEGGVKVPLIISGGPVTAGVTSRAQINIVDIFPTLAELSGLDLPNYGNGYSFAPMLLGDKKLPRQFNYTEYVSDRVTGWAVRDGHHKLIHLEGGTEQLYDLDVDPGEKTNLIHSSKYADKAAVLREFGEIVRAQGKSNPEIREQNREPGFCHNFVGKTKQRANDLARGIGFDGTVEVTHDYDHCTIVSNAIPDHDFNNGTRPFPNQTQSVVESFSFPDKPIIAPNPTPLSLRWDNAIMLNGVKVDVLSAGCHGIGNGKIGCNDDSRAWKV